MATHSTGPDAPATHQGIETTVFLALVGSLAMMSYTVAGALF